MGKRLSDKKQFVCQSCGYISPKWLGRCTECGAWNSFVEERVQPRRGGGATSRSRLEGGRPKPLNEVQTSTFDRVSTGNREFDRVLGGGFVPGSVVLLGGQPGIGKSTILLQVAAALAAKRKKVLYVSGEESEEQIRLRADRLGIQGDHILLLSEQSLDGVLAALEAEKPDLLIVDSIQTIYHSEFESAPGSVTQVRECTSVLTTIAKQRNLPVILVGHVTKEGFLAGPKVLEHIVDASLFFEGDSQHPYRILRATKNRFGSTDEMGVFEMTGAGLREVPNPSEFFLSERTHDVPGSVVTCLVQGTRPVLLEIQALTTVSRYGMPQRTCTGFDPRRLAMLLAVLERRAGLNAGSHDVFVNVAGGIRAEEPAADLAVVAAVASSLKNRPAGADLVAFGEVGLAGEIRRVQHAERRLAEATRLGFCRMIVPKLSRDEVPTTQGITVQTVSRLDEALKLILS